MSFPADREAFLNWWSRAKVCSTTTTARQWSQSTTWGPVVGRTRGEGHADPLTNLVTVTIGQLHRRRIEQPAGLTATPGADHRIAEAPTG